MDRQSHHRRMLCAETLAHTTGGRIRMERRLAAGDFPRRFFAVVTFSGREIRGCPWRQERAQTGQFSTLEAVPNDAWFARQPEDDCRRKLFSRNVLEFCVVGRQVKFLDDRLGDCYFG
jgi:hypothetical protein